MIYFSFRRINKIHLKNTKCQLLISRKAGLQSKEQYKKKSYSYEPSLGNHCYFLKGFAD